MSKRSLISSRQVLLCSVALSVFAGAASAQPAPPPAPSDQGKIEKVTDELTKPNGLCFSPDYKKLYVVDTGEPKNILSFDVLDAVKLGKGKTFAVNKGALSDQKGKGGSDGVRCDVNGNVWASAGWVGDGFDGVHVFSPEGQRIGFIDAKPDQHRRNHAQQSEARDEKQNSVRLGQPADPGRFT